MAIFLLFVALQLSSLWRSDTSRLVTAVADDAYFYFEIARNLAHTGHFTFDGRTLTNGFHPLWMGLLIPFSLSTNDSMLLLRIIGSFSALLLGLAGYISLRHIGSRCPLISFCLSAVLMMKFFAIFTEYCMETSVLVPLCVVALAMMSKMNLCSFQSVKTSQLVLLGIVLSLIQLARLDAVLLNCVILVTITALNYRSPNLARLLRNLAVLAMPSLVTGSAYLIANYVTFGHLVPVSGVSKSMGSSVLNQNMLTQLTGLRYLKDLTNIWTIFSFLLILAIVYLVIFLLRHDRRVSGVNASGESCVAAITSIFFLLFVGYYLFGSSWRLWGWYSYPALLCAIFVLPIVGTTVEERIAQWNVGRKVLPAVSAFAGLLTILMMFTAAVRWGVWTGKNVGGNFQYQNYELAESLNAELQGSPLLAMGDRAGSFAYFFKGSVLQLEGLVGDYDLLQAIRQDHLTEYMTRHGVQYVVAYTGPSGDYERWTMLVPFPEFSSGPHAQVFLCRDTEFLRRVTPAGNIFVWKWPSCKSKLSSSTS